MKDKTIDSFEAAVADIGDGASIMAFSWGITGTPQNLIQALTRKESKDLVCIAPMIVPGYVGMRVADESEIITPYALVPQLRKIITAWAGIRAFGTISILEELVAKGKIELEMTSHGALMQRMRAGGSGMGCFYTRTGVGTILEEGKEKRIIDGEEHILETPLKADFGFVRAYKADKTGNLIYRGAGRGANPVIAMASKVTIAEVDEIVEPGELDPETIVTPGIFIDRIVKVEPGQLGGHQQRAEVMQKHLSFMR